MTSINIILLDSKKKKKSSKIESNREISIFYSHIYRYLFQETTIMIVLNETE